MSNKQDVFKPAFDANDEIGQVTNLMEAFIGSCSPEMTAFLDSLDGSNQSDDKVKNKLRSFQLNTLEAMVEMVQQIKSKKLSMTTR